MRSSTLLKRNLTYFWRTNLAVVLGVATAVAVLAGALLVGDSVRASLRNLLLLRLGNTDYVITATGFFREGLARELQAREQFSSSFTAACPIIAFEGAITHEESRRRASAVQVYGIDERFWAFHGRKAYGLLPEDSEVLLSPALAEELGGRAGDSILLRVEKPSDIPADSLHGRKDDIGRTLRLEVRAEVPAAALGEFSLRPQQGAVRAAFVSLRRLQRELGQQGKVNTILLAAVDSTADKAAKGELAGRLLKETCSLEDFGLKLRVLEKRHSLSLESATTMINDALAEKARAAASRLGLKSSFILTYLVNAIRLGERQVPYSLVTALDENLAVGLDEEAAKPLPPILLGRWAARDLGAKIGDKLTLEYYLWREQGVLTTQTTEFRLTDIVAASGVTGDPDLAPEYPGITESKTLSDWDPPFPMELGLIRPIDEQYWEQYRTTPKAFIPLAKGRELWQSRYGALTSVRIFPASNSDLQQARALYQQSLREVLDPLEMGFSIDAVRAQGLAASRGATDFGQYFLYFSFFLMVSALLLAGLFFKLGIEQRAKEIGILRAIGFPLAKLRLLFLSEAAALAAAGSLLGVLGALAYGELMVFGLRTWWAGAVGTRMLALQVEPFSLIIGGTSGVLVALSSIIWMLRSLASTSPRSLLTGSWSSGAEGRKEGVQQRAEAPEGSSSGRQERSFSRSRSAPLSRSPALPLRLSVSASRVAIAFSATGVVLLLVASLNWVGEVASFFGAGLSLLVAWLCLLSVWLQKRDRKYLQGRGWWAISRMGGRNATSRPGRSILCIALIAAATFIIVAVESFRRDDSRIVLEKKSGSGGYPLLAESLLPLHYDPNTEEGRENLVLSWPGDTALDQVTFTRFRLRPGDDASCLNLYRPRQPRILGVTAEFIRSARFAFQSSLAQTPEERANPWLLLSKELHDPQSRVVPVIADYNSMKYVLHRELGDELVINQESGRPVRLRLVGALSDSIFQSELLMAEEQFLRLFPEQEGFRFFLIEARPDKVSEVTSTLEERLSDFGFDIVSTAERLASFHQVENTYLSTFQTLGGLGLALGTLGLAAVLLRNVLERRRELALLRAVGYHSTHLAVMVVAENALLLLSGVVIGTVCALLAIAPVLMTRGGYLSPGSLSWLLLAVVVTGLTASLAATAAALRSPLIPALRAE